MDKQVARLMMIRNDSSYNKDMRSFLKVIQEEKKAVVPVGESAVDVSHSLKNALHVVCENEGYRTRLRESEVAVILQYKDMTNRRMIADFSQTHNALQKISWFH